VNRSLFKGRGCAAGAGIAAASAKQTAGEEIAAKATLALNIAATYSPLLGYTPAPYRAPLSRDLCIIKTSEVQGSPEGKSPPYNPAGM